MKTKKLMLMLLLSLINPGIFSQPVLKLTPYGTGFQEPVDIKNAGDGRLFILEQAGIIRIMDSTGQVMSTPFLDITDRVKSTGNEQGLLGLAFHPDYKNNGYFYVDYTGAGDSTHISRFSVSSMNPDSAVASGEFGILTLYKPFINHNGGDLAFGPDGFLYIGTGDGGGAGDPGNRAQNLMQLLGKMLRIDVDNGNPYAIPPSNPFINVPNALGEIWALGLRNPWRFSFDPLTGDLWIADVGQNAYEEIDFQPSVSPGGENYGWRCYEGNAIYNNTGCNSSSSYTFPVFVYPHMPGDPCTSVTGGYMYRGSDFINFYGHYFFADFCNDDIWTLHDSAGTWKSVYQGRYPGNSFSSFGVDNHGEIYLAGHTSGIIYKITDSTTGIETIDKPRVKIYPDPFTSFFIVEIQAHPSGNVKLEVVDLQGRKLFKNGYITNRIEVTLGSVSHGIYFLHLEIEGKHVYKKIIRE